MKSFQPIWRWINEPARDTDPRRVPPKPVWRLFSRFFLNRHPGKILLTIIFSCFVCLNPFVISYAVAYLSDDIIEIQLMDQQPERPDFDPAAVEENRRFQLTEKKPTQGLATLHDNKPGKGIAEKLYLLTWLTVILILWTIFQHIARYIAFERSVAATQDGIYRMRQQVHDKLNNLPLSYHDQFATGRLLTHLFSDMHTILVTLTAILRQIPEFSAAIILGLVILFVINPTMAWLAVLSLVCFCIGYRWFAKRQKAVAVNLREKEGLLIAHMASRVSHFRLVKSFRRETAEVREFLRKAIPNLQLRFASLMLAIGLSALWNVIGVFSTVAVIYIGVNQVRSGGMTAGEFLLFHGAFVGLFWPVAALTQLVTHYYNLRATSIKVMRVLDEPIDLSSPNEPVPLPQGSPSVQFDHVSMHYHRSEQPSVQEVTFTIEPGKRLAIMGPSGAGKSTVARLASRLYDPTQGRILMNGIDLKSFRLRELRDFVGYVSQEPVVFSGSIADNIRYGSETAAAPQVIAAAQYAQIHGYIATLPERYRTLTQERGLTLSGGQKQRVNLARALLSDPRFLVLDDCTSALDAETEARLIEAFEQALLDRTALIVTHRVCVALSCDHVMMMNEGRAIEFGSPWKLLEQGGAFAELYRQQVGKLHMVG